MSAGADGTDAAADAEEVGEGASEVAGAPYCAATKAGRATRAREVVKIIMLSLGDEEFDSQTCLIYSI